MTSNMQKLIELRDEIMAANADTRHLFQPQFSELLDQCISAGETVPADLRSLGEELLEDAMEAQFDNMPV